MKKNYAYTMMLMGMCCLSANAQSLIDEDFESGKGDWASRGGESVAVSKDAAHSGNQSLKVSSRSSYWNGASIGSKEFEAGKSYNVEAYVYFDGSTYKPASAITGDMVPLKDAYDKDKYFRFGTCVSGYGVTNAATQNMIKTHFNSVTPENELKPDATLNQSASKQKGNNVNPQVQLSNGARNILKFCSDNGIALRGHTFVWHSQTPTWLFKENFESSGKNVSKEIMDQRMENYIKNVFELVTKEYPNLNIYSWDVVNEAFNEDGTLRTAGDNSMSPGTSYWMQIYGSNEYIYKAFTLARKYAPKGCKLYYNDYNEYNAAKRDGIYKLVKDMFEKGICDGVGMQSHLDVGYPSASLYEQALQKFTSIGCDVQVTELDVTTTSGEAGQATYYKNLFDLYKRYADKISAVVVWGVNDSNSWRSSKSPLLFNGSNEPKQCYWKIIDGMQVAQGGQGGEEAEGLESLPFALCFQYEADETKYPTIALETVPSKTWTKLSGVMEIPEGVTDIKLYVQSSDNGSDADLIDFYIDDVKCEGTESEVAALVGDAGTYLGQNVPNPAADQTTINFAIQNAGNVVINLYSATGAKVKEIVNKQLAAGVYSVSVNVSTLPKGVYVYEMKANGASSKKQMIVK